MAKTILQQKLELQWRKPVRQLLLDTLESHRGEPHAVRNTASDLDITDSTIYKWCREWGICIKHITRPCEPAPTAGPH